MTQREQSLSTARICGAILIILGIANAIGGVIEGRHFRTPTVIDVLGDPSSRISSTGRAVITGAASVALILVLAGVIVIAFANAMRSTN